MLSIIIKYIYDMHMGIPHTVGLIVQVGALPIACLLFTTPGDPGRKLLSYRVVCSVAHAKRVLKDTVFHNLIIGAQI